MPSSLDVINATSAKRLEVYFFPTHAITSGKYKWKEIFNNKMYLDRQSLSEEELEKIEWNIYYKGENPSVKEDN